MQNIRWHHGKVTKADRSAMNRHHSALIWLTGLPASGKSTIAHEMEFKLFQQHIRSYVLDGDNVRHGLNKGLGFSPDDRKENIRRIGEVSKLFLDAGMITIAAFVSPYESDRLMVRQMLNKDEMIEVYVKCDLKTCELRDPKNLYEKARRGEILGFTGVSAPYEAPQTPEIMIETDKMTVEESVDKILSYLKGKGILTL